MQLIVNRSLIAILIRVVVIGIALSGTNACTPRDPSIVEETEEQLSAEEPLSPAVHAPSRTAPETAKTPPPKLDLSREHIETIVSEQGEDQITESLSALPDLFSEAEQGKRLSVNGRLLTKDEADSLIGTVEGAEIKLEVKTQ